MRDAVREATLERRGKHYAGGFLAMGSPCEVLVDTGDQRIADQLMTDVAAEAWRIEAKFSRYLPGNVIDRINKSAGQPVVVDGETADLLDFSVALFELSAGGFDITSGVLRQAWTFDGSNRLPSSSLVDAALRHVGWQQVRWERPELQLQSGMQIDFGGLGKEYAVDRATALAEAQADVACLINFGGDLRACGGRPEHDGWQVGIDACEVSGDAASKLIRLRRGALATSGDSRRNVLHNGNRYGHILDPRTGWPIIDAPRSVTVAADTCTEAGMLATLAMLRGQQAETFLTEEGVRYWSFR